MQHSPGNTPRKFSLDSPFDSPDVDVLIAGAGPVGLFLACELRLAGLSVLVLEQAGDPSSPLKALPFGMRGLSVPSVEALHRRGLLDAMGARAAPSAQQPAAAAGTPHWMDQPRRAGGHFAGIQFFQDRIDTGQWPYRLADPGPAGSPMATSMAHIESVLAAHATAIGVEIRRGAGVTGIEQDEDGLGEGLSAGLSAGISICSGDDIVTARWLVGCDGGRSTVRKAAGFTFAGTDAEFTGYSVEVTLDDPGQLLPGRHHTPTGMYTYQAPGTIAMVDFDGGARHRSTITREHVQAVLRRISGVDVTLTALALATTWTDRACQATAYRRGRVLLAGDAAHIHSPLGGQGLNLGIGDAMNLGWKLAATVRGDAPEGLLDSYFTERHPLGAQILDWSRAQVAVMRPQPAERALAAILRELIETGDGATWFAGRVWGVVQRYDLGEGNEGAEGDAVHPLTGRSAPDFALADGTTLAEHLRGGKALLLEFDSAAPLRTLAGRWHGRIVHVASAASEADESCDWFGLRAVLVRPDGIVAWASAEAPDWEKLTRCATRWFGAPAPLGAAVL